MWLLSSVVLLGLAIWRGALDQIAEQVGVAYPPNALFIVAFGFVLWMLLHFSVAVSRLSDQSKVLAQRIALLEERMRRREVEAGEGSDDDEDGEFAELGSVERRARVPPVGEALAARCSGGSRARWRCCWPSSAGC